MAGPKFLMCLLAVLQLCFFRQGSTEITVAAINKLSTKLLDGYNKNTLPAANFTQQYSVNISAVLTALGDLDEVEEKLSTVVLFFFEWHDVSMQWDPEEYDGIDNITMNYDDVWKPTLLLINPHEGYARQGAGKQMDNCVSYGNDGSAYTFRLVTFQTSCDLDTTFFPFDVQSCKIHLYLAQNDGYLIKLNTGSERGLSQPHKENGAWFVLEERVEGSKYSTMTIVFKLKRKPLHSLINVLLPIIVLALLTPLVFIMPKSSGERVGYSVTMLLAISVYMTIISDHLPDHADPLPLVTIMIFVWYMLNSTIVLVVIVNTRVKHINDERPVPLWLRRFVILTRKVVRRKRLHSAYADDAEESKKFLEDVENSGNTPENAEKSKENEINEEEPKTNKKARNEAYLRMYPDGVTWKEVSVAIDKWALVCYYFLKLTIPIIFLAYMKSRSKDSE